MTKLPLKMIGLFVTVFATTQFGAGEKAQAATPTTGPQVKAGFDTDIHGGGCGCLSCLPPSDISAPGNPV